MILGPYQQNPDQGPLSGQAIYYDIIPFSMHACALCSLCSYQNKELTIIVT